MKKSHFKKNGKGKRGLRGFGPKQLTARANGIEDVLYVQENPTLTGLLAPSSGAVVVSTLAKSMPLIARNMGARLAQLAGVYAQWKVHTLRFKYTPHNYQGAYLSSDLATVPNSYPLVSDENKITSRMVGGFVLDPLEKEMSFTEMIQCGGKTFNPARPYTWSLGASKWLFVDSVPEVGQDPRMVSPGFFELTSNAVGTASPNNRQFGYISMEWDISFRYPVDADADEVSRVNPITEFLSRPLVKVDETKKSEEYEPLLIPSNVISVPSTPRDKPRLKVDVRKLFYGSK